MIVNKHDKARRCKCRQLEMVYKALVKVWREANSPLKYLAINTSRLISSRIDSTSGVNGKDIRIKVDSRSRGGVATSTNY
jgi:hypothetical protein